MGITRAVLGKDAANVNLFFGPCGTLNRCGVRIPSHKWLGYFLLSLRDLNCLAEITELFVPVHDHFAKNLTFFHCTSACRVRMVP